MSDTEIEYISRSEEETMRIGREISRTLAPGAVVALFGDLGSGKTVFTKGFCETFGIPPAIVNSPTFVIINEYAGRWHQQPLRVRHFDFYRVHTPDEIMDLGITEFLDDRDAVSVIEWPERIADFLKPPYRTVRFEITDNGNRRLCIREESGCIG